jgi:hypothetical protein
MSALSHSPHLTLESLVEQDLIDSVRRCRFCNCSPDEPCIIPVGQDEEGNYFLAQSESEATEIVACNWFLPGICNAPACMEKLQQELRDDGLRIVDRGGKGKSA